MKTQNNSFCIGKTVSAALQGGFAFLLIIGAGIIISNFGIQGVFHPIFIFFLVLALFIFTSKVKVCINPNEKKLRVAFTFLGLTFGKEHSIEDYDYGVVKKNNSKDEYRICLHKKEEDKENFIFIKGNLKDILSFSSEFLFKNNIDIFLNNKNGNKINLKKYCDLA